MTRSAPYSAAASLEEYLGDPADERNALSFARSIEFDERDEYPEDACRLVERWGFHDFGIPAEAGGRFGSFEELLLLLRVVARRDLTVAVALGQVFLGAIPIWISGTEEQKRRVAATVKGGGRMALGLTERAHGSDLLACETGAVPHGAGGFLLSGEKWLINNGTRGAALTVFARTSPAGGPRGFSLFLIEKDKLPPGSYEHLPKVKTLGIRGADISGVRFDGAALPAAARVGAEGTGLETVLRGLFVTRTLCAGLSLGAADTALRLTLDFALSRRLYGDTAYAIPAVQSALAQSFLDLLICECVAVAAARGLHVAPEQASVWSAVVKYFVPTRIEEAIRDLSVLIGARGYLRDDPVWGTFQKTLRDNAVVSLFDGSTAVNLNGIALQLKSLKEHRAKAAADGAGAQAPRLAAIFDLSEPLPRTDFGGLTLFNKGRDEVLEGLDSSLSRLRAEADGGVQGAVCALGDQLRQRLRELDLSVGELVESPGHRSGRSPEFIALAKTYCALHAAAACIHTWFFNRHAADRFLAGGEWLVLCLDRLLGNSRPGWRSSYPSYEKGAASELLRLREEGLLFSLRPTPLARPSGVGR